MLAANQDKPRAVVVDETAAYWIAGDSIEKYDKAEGQFSTLSSGHVSPRYLIHDSTALYVGKYLGGIVRVPKDGSAPLELVADAHANSKGIALDDTHVYWTERDGQVMKISKLGGPSIAVFTEPRATSSSMICSNGSCTSLPSSSSIGPLAVDATAVYFGAGSQYSIRSAGDQIAARVDRFGYLLGTPKDGGEPFLSIDRISEPIVLATDAEGVFWLEIHSPYVSAHGRVGHWLSVEDAFEKGSKGMVLATPKLGLGGKVRTIASEQSNPRAIALDGEYVYWVNYGTSSNGLVIDLADGAVMMTRKSGGAPTILASDQDHPSSIAVDETYVYWTTADAVMRQIKSHASSQP